MIVFKEGGIKILPSLFLISFLNAGITKFNLYFLSERYYVNGNFKNTLTKPFYKDYENSINLFINGFIYKRELLNYNLKTYLLWQGWNKNLYGIEEKNFLKAPFLFNLNLLEKSKFPFKFTVKKEVFKKEDKIIFERKTLTYIISQGLLIRNFLNLNFSYSWGKENSFNKKSLAFTSNYSFKENTFSLYYNREFKSLYQNIENFNFNYNYKKGDINFKWDTKYFFRNSFTYINSSFVYHIFKNRNYFFDMYYSFNRSKFTTTNFLNTSFKKFFSERFISNTTLGFQTNSLKEGKNFYEDFSQTFYLKFLNLPRTLTISPGFSVFFSQNPEGNGWGYLLKEGNLYEQKNFLIFENLRFFVDLYYKTFNDTWILKNEKKYGYYSGINLSYNSKRYLLSLNFYYFRDITRINNNINTWIKYHTRVEFNTKEIPFNFSYVNEYIKTEYSLTRKEFIRISFSAPLRLFNMFTLEEKFYFSEKFENDLKIAFERNYGDLILSLGFTYIYLIYPESESNIIFHFLVKRNIKLK